MRRGAFLLVGGALLVLGLVVVVGVALAVPDDDRPVADVGHTDTSTTAPAPAPDPVTTTTTTPATRTVVSTRSTPVVRTDPGGEVTIVNEGSAVANTGGNTVIGPPDATVVRGPATAIGNLSRP